MLSLEEMIVRFAVALLLGALMGFERELIGKEAGVRTLMLVSGGAAIFSIISIALPYIGAGPAALEDILGNTDFSRVASNIVVGVGFLGAGIIMKNDNRIHGLTTSALVWTAAAVGTLAGIGLVSFALITGVAVSVLLYLMRGMSIGPNGSK